MTLRVVSALARLDLDPWQETANLARLPRQTAVERLAAYIVALPDRPSAQPDVGAIAACLIARLPRQSVSNALSARSSGAPNIPSATETQTHLYLAVFLVIVLWGIGLTGSMRLAAQVEKAATPAASGNGSKLPSVGGQ